MLITPYKRENLKEILRLFYETVHTVAAKDYTLAQLDAWAPRSLCAADEEKWHASLSRRETLLAWEGGKLAGFGDADKTGYLDRLYTAAERQGRGVGTEILKRLEAYAANAGAKEAYTYASLSARPFFERRGYLAIEERRVERRGAALTNFLMTKKL